MMSFQAVSDLHILPRNETWTTEYYLENVLKKTARSAINRKASTGGILRRKLLPDMSKAIFQQDGAPSHRARATQDFCKTEFPHFWDKEEWPGNSPDVSPIENLWAIVDQSIGEMKQATDEKSLIENVKRSWAEIKPQTLYNLVAGMPGKMHACVRESGDYINKQILYSVG